MNGVQCTWTSSTSISVCLLFLIRFSMQEPRVVIQSEAGHNDSFTYVHSSSSSSSSSSLSLSAHSNSVWTNSTTCPTSCTCRMSVSFQLNEQLKTVNCSYAGFYNFPRDFPVDQEYLILSHNNLYDLHQLVTSTDQLVSLDLSHNQLKQLGRGHAFLNFSNLRHLDLSSNEFKTLFAGVFRGLKRLEILQMKDGQLRYIDEHAFDGLENLRQLDLARNHISSVYLELFQSIVNLHVLNLHGNTVSHLTGGIFTSLNSLRKLIVSENRITGINNNAFVGLESLEELHLNDNYLTKVPSEALQSLKRLRYLNVGSNKLQQIAVGDFVHSPVEEIWIHKERELMLIEKGAFWDLPNLKSIHLELNPQLTFIDPQAFLSLPILQTLYLHNNSLVTIQEDLINNIMHHESGHERKLDITLSGNPILCDCNVHYLHKCLKENNQTGRLTLLDSNEIRCAQPIELRSSKVAQLDISKVKRKCPPTLVGSSPSKFNTSVHKKIGDRFFIHCRALGLPPPKIHWILPSGLVLNETSNTVHIQLRGEGSLRIFHLKPKDSGLYTCVAENEVGSALNGIRLFVENIDLHIWVLTVSSTFVTVVWNGTARNSFPEYQLLYREDEVEAEERFIRDSSSGISSSSSGTSSISSNDSSRNHRQQQQQHSSSGVHNEVYEAVKVNHYLRSYTIGHLLPETKYKVCIGLTDQEAVDSSSSGSNSNLIKSKGSTSPASRTTTDLNGFLQISCTTVLTQSQEYLLEGISHTSNLAIAFSLSFALVVLLFGATLVFATRRYQRQREYQTPEKSLLDTAMGQIPMENIYSPLMSAQQ